ncbi:MAG: aminotransferase class I/II-fold pyridoxal phosphate-dependent enzyme [Lachnospiraceae bacterium]|nr:aminotransferase class I/II-fold pyridoxal phosphate-dependent enzyme [Lachnospiraceae bacterium]
MNTPIYEFVEAYRESDAVRLHMPGHKGVAGPLGVEPFDITEIDGADVLSQACGIIAESEANAGALFGCRTLYSTEGSSLCVRAMIFLLKMTALHRGLTPRILAARNVHRSFLDAVALLDIEVDWIMPKEACDGTASSYESCEIDGAELAQILEQARESGRMPSAVYITTPDYLGNCTDVAALAEVCHSNGCFLAVDNAHGAYLKFLAESRHPMDLGADVCCDSAHKTLPVLTGGAYLHLSRNMDPYLAERAMAMFATTSPSYLILQSLDLCNAYLEDGGTNFERTAQRVSALREELTKAGYRTCGDEPWKITLVAGESKDDGTVENGTFSDGDTLAETLLKYGITVEYHDDRHVVMMFSAQTTEGEFALVGSVLSQIAGEQSEGKAAAERTDGSSETEAGEQTEDSGETAAEPCGAKRIPVPVQVLTPAEAMWAESEYVDASQCIGRVLAEPLVHMPPCVPVYMCGEVLGKDAVKYVKGRVRVVKEPVARFRENNARY